MGRTKRPGKFGGHRNTGFPVQHAITWLADKRWHSPAEKLRKKANKYCLACRGDECVAKQWPEDRVQELQLCQSLYCVPERFSKTLLSDQSGWAPHTANVAYKVEKNGRGKLLSYTATVNAKAIRSYKKEINQSVGSFLRNTRFVPLIVDGERKELVNLYYTVKVYNRN